MTYETNFVFHCPRGHDRRLDTLVKEYVQDGVAFVVVAGNNCESIEEMIDELVAGDGARDYDLLTSSHRHESLDETIEFESPSPEGSLVTFRP